MEKNPQFQIRKSVLTQKQQEFPQQITRQPSVAKQQQQQQQQQNQRATIGKQGNQRATIQPPPPRVTSNILVQTSGQQFTSKHPIQYRRTEELISPKENEELQQFKLDTINDEASKKELRELRALLQQKDQQLHAKDQQLQQYQAREQQQKKLEEENRKLKREVQGLKAQLEKKSQEAPIQVEQSRSNPFELCDPQSLLLAIQLQERERRHDQQRQYLQFMQEAFQPQQNNDPNYVNTDNMTYEQILELQEKIGFVSRGLTKQQIKSIRKTKVNEMNKPKLPDVCTVCYSEFRVGENFRNLGCNHIYHGKCIKQWLQNEKKCPICKEEVKTN